jgi:hypothetical protein
LLEMIEREDVNPTGPAPRTKAHGTACGRHHDPGELREVPRWHVPAARGVRARREVEVISSARRRASARFGVRANNCVQRSAGRVAAIAVSAALAGRR